MPDGFPDDNLNTEIAEVQGACSRYGEGRTDLALYTSESKGRMPIDDIA